MIKVVALCINFQRITKEAVKPQHLTQTHIHTASMVIVKLLKRETFADELKCLETKSQVKSNSPIASLNPFLDKNGILRVGGRLNQSDLRTQSQNAWHAEDYEVLHLSKRWETYPKIEWAPAHHSWIPASIFSVLSSLRRAERTWNVGESCSPAWHLGPFILKSQQLLRLMALKMPWGASLASKEMCTAYVRIGVQTLSEPQMSSPKLSRSWAMLKSRNTTWRTTVNSNSIPQVPAIGGGGGGGGVWEIHIRTAWRILTSVLYRTSTQLDDDCLWTLFTETASIMNSRPLTVDNLNDPASLSPITPNYAINSCCATTQIVCASRHIQQEEMATSPIARKPVWSLWKK